jgi:hypothetical protein
MNLIDFLASGAGRVVRVVAGLVLVGVGIYLLTGPSVVAGLIVGIIGLIPLFAGLFDVCVFAPLFGAPFQGASIRQRAHAS